MQDHLLKMLCPAALIGTIIGKGGATINKLNQNTGARIKLSQNQDFFPTTNDRIISIQGSLDVIGAAITELVTIIIEVVILTCSTFDYYHTSFILHLLHSISKPCVHCFFPS